MLHKKRVIFKKFIDIISLQKYIARSLTGAIAQLGERYAGSVEVDGSIPSSSTKYWEMLYDYDLYEESSKCIKREDSLLLQEFCSPLVVW